MPGCSCERDPAGRSTAWSRSREDHDGGVHHRRARQVLQAVLLGLARRSPHAGGGLDFRAGGQYSAGNGAARLAEPYFQIASAASSRRRVLDGVADLARADHAHDHHHPDAHRPISRGDGCWLTLEVFEDGVRRAGLRAEGGSFAGPRPSRSRRCARMAPGRRSDSSRAKAPGEPGRDPEPHAFTARVRLDGPAGSEMHEVALRGSTTTII